MTAKRIPTNSFRAWLPFGVAGLLTVFGAIGWSVLYLARCHEAAARSRDDLDACYELARRIEVTRSEPIAAATEARQPQELAGEIEGAAAAASIPQAHLVRIDPQPTRRVEDTSYKEQATLVEMRGVTLREIMTCLKSLAAERPELRVTALRLAAPRISAANIDQRETWDVELTLTQFIFVPKTRPTE